MPQNTFRAVLGASWAPLGCLLGCPGRVWDRLAHLSGCFGRFLGCLGRLLGCLGAYWAVLGPSRGPRGLQDTSRHLRDPTRNSQIRDFPSVLAHVHIFPRFPPRNAVQNGVQKWPPKWGLKMGSKIGSKQRSKNGVQNGVPDFLGLSEMVAPRQFCFDTLDGRGPRSARGPSEGNFSAFSKMGQQVGSKHGV